MFVSITQFLEDMRFIGAPISYLKIVPVMTGQHPWVPNRKRENSQLNNCSIWWSYGVHTIRVYRIFVRVWGWGEDSVWRCEMSATWPIVIGPLVQVIRRMVFNLEATSIIKDMILTFESANYETSWSMKSTPPRYDRAVIHNGKNLPLT